MKKNIGVLSVMFALVVVSAIGCGSESESQPGNNPGTPNPASTGSPLADLVMPTAITEVGYCDLRGEHYLDNKGVCMDMVEAGGSDASATLVSILLAVCNPNTGGFYHPNESCATAGVDAYCLHIYRNGDGSIQQIRRIIMSEDSPEAQQACLRVGSHHGTRSAEYHGRSTQ